jgi:nucleoside-diphosphate-sugar epimerase
MSTESQNVILFGATGPIGINLIRILSQKYPQWTIHAVSRSGSDSKVSELIKSYPNVHLVQGDPLNRDSVLTLSQDKNIIYSTLGFARYERKYWAEHWPIVVDNLLAATLQDENNKKKLVFCDNLYAYGPTTNISPRNTSVVPPSKKSKPAIRSLLRSKLQSHMNDHPGTVTVVGGADFFGAPVMATSFYGDTLTGQIVDAALSGSKKPSALIIGSPNKIHDGCYTEDSANALSIASVNDTAYDKFWICPHTIKNKTFQQVANDIAAIAYQETTKVDGVVPAIDIPAPKVSMTVMTTWMVYLFSPFMSFMGEMIEMLDFFRKDYTVDDSDFCETFNVQPTPYDEVLDSCKYGINQTYGQELGSPNPLQHCTLSAM